MSASLITVSMTCNDVNIDDGEMVKRDPRKRNFSRATKMSNGQKWLYITQ